MFFPKTLGKKAVGSATAARSALAAAAGASAHSAPSAPLCERHRSCAALRGSGGQRMGCGGSKLEEGGADQGSSSRTDDRGRAGKSVVPARQNGGSDPEAGASFKKVRPERREAYSSGKQALGPSAGPAPSQQPAAAPKSAADMDQLRKSCATIMLFSTMTADQQEKIFEAMFEVRCKTGQHMINQGEIGDVLYVVESGTYEAFLRQAGDKPVQKYASGQLFGELAIMYNCPRAATIKCTAPGRLFGLSRGAYEEIMRSTLELKMDSKSQFLRTVELLSMLSEAERNTLSDLLEEASYQEGETMWSAGDPADCAILIRHGSVEVIENEGPGPRASSARLKDGTNLESGDFFGTQALDDLKGNPPKRRVTGVAATAVDVYKMSRQAALQLGDLPELIINNSRVKAIRNLEWFTGLPRADRLAAAKSLPSYGYARDEPIVVRDAIGGQGMYVIIEGTVGVTGGDKDETLGEGDFFLAESLTTRAAAAPATYTSNGGVSCVVVDRTRLRELVEFREEESKEEQAPIALSDLKLVATLGVGGFGRVKMVSDPVSGKYFALKCMYKGLVIAKRQTEHIMNERRLLGMCRHTFLPHLIATFQDHAQIYVLMDLIQGGELFSLVASRGRLYEHEAAFYCANVTCALEYLHTRNIAYRDLKPENLMIDHQGYLKVVDFGFAKVIEDRTFTVCGTPEYLAPETIRRAGHTTTVDWWALGVLLYELITGQSPFHGGSQMDVLTRIVCGRVPRDELLSSTAWAIITDLLEVDPIRRLGSRVRGRRGVREHAFFSAHIDVNALEKRQLAAPWVPTIESATDLRNFDDYEQDSINEDASEWERYIKIYPDAFASW